MCNYQISTYLILCNLFISCLKFSYYSKYTFRHNCGELCKILLFRFDLTMHQNLICYLFNNYLWLIFKNIYIYSNTSFSSLCKMHLLTFSSKSAKRKSRKSHLLMPQIINLNNSSIV